RPHRTRMSFRHFIALVLLALLPSPACAEQNAKCSFLEVTYYSGNQPGNIQQKKMEEILGLRSIVYKYTIPPHKALDIVAEIKELGQVKKSYPQSINNSGATPAKGELTIYRYKPLNMSTNMFNRTAFEIRMETGASQTVYPELASDTVAINSVTELGFPMIRCASDTEATLYNYNALTDNDVIDFRIIAKITDVKLAPVKN
ncbi:MAG: hypothetical protein ABIP97_10625, partial [Chthoniobacterales bacterium]